MKLDRPWIHFEMENLRHQLSCREHDVGFLLGALTRTERWRNRWHAVARSLFVRKNMFMDIADGAYQRARKALRRAESAEARCAALEGMLRRFYELGYCPHCWTFDPMEEHAPDCELAALLGEGK